MSRQLFTAADVRRVAREQNTKVLVLGPRDLITPEAVDVLNSLGWQLVRESEAGGQTPPATAPPPKTALPPLKVVRGKGVALESFGADLATPGTNVRLKDVVTAEDRSPMATGYMALDRGEFPWTLTYDEVDVVLEGELVITRGAEVVRGGPGDVIFIPKGSSITFGTPSHTRFVYIAFPVNWSELA